MTITNRISLIVVQCMLVLTMGAAFSQEPAPQTWDDGTPIIRFDKHEDTTMVIVADWQDVPERRWAGPSIWTNRLQDWRVGNNVLRCEARPGTPCRTAHLLTYDLQDNPEPFRLEVIITMAPGFPADGWAGFLIGAGQGELDYRGASLVHHTPGLGGGILAVVETRDEGGLAFRDMTQKDFPVLEKQVLRTQEPIRLDYNRMMLNLEGLPTGDGLYDLRLSVWAHNAGTLLGAMELHGIPAEQLLGNVALCAHPGGKGAQHQFETFKVGGERLEHHPDHTFGPIAGTLYSLSDNTLRLSAQFMSLGSETRKYSRKPVIRRPAAHLEGRLLNASEDTPWEPLERPRTISPPDYYVMFEIKDWDTSQDWETRVVYVDEKDNIHTYRTIVCHDPVEKEVVSLAAFACMGVMGHTASSPEPKQEIGQLVTGKWTPANVWMPFEDAINTINREQNVDILFFTGDQIYEGKPTWTDPDRMPMEDYFYKWLLWHWSSRELTNHLPTLVQPDDHDVYHGNLWGWGGRSCLTDHNWDGGYICSPYFVNMVHRTQTGHNPAPYDPIPTESGITNYYCDFNFGEIGFAVLEDRKFKSPPDVKDPDQQTQLGPKQLQFLEEWAQDWKGQQFKTVISQTVYAAMHTTSKGNLERDPDSNGFPKVGRDRSVDLFRRCGAFVVTGDQHIATFTRLGIEKPSDAVYEFCVPAVGNIFWRWFYPKIPGTDRRDNEPENCGEFTDAWGNYFRMIAVANPEDLEVNRAEGSLRTRWVVPYPQLPNDVWITERTCQGEGYGLVRFNKRERIITAECWPHGAKPSAGDKPFKGWPQQLAFDDLDGRTPVAWLPQLVFEKPDRYVVKIVNQATGQLVKATRVNTDTYKPGVFDADALYTVEASLPEKGLHWAAHDLKAVIQQIENKSSIKVVL